jgi:hypothetical protein
MALKAEGLRADLSTYHPTQVWLATAAAFRVTQLYHTIRDLSQLALQCLLMQHSTLGIGGQQMWQNICTAS